MAVTLWVQPGARSTRVGGRHETALVVKVRARALEGAANRAVLKAVADALDRRPRDVTLERGATSRLKVVRVAGPADEILERLAILFEKD